jgi:hypothetical protein
MCISTVMCVPVAVTYGYVTCTRIMKKTVYMIAVKHYVASRFVVWFIKSIGTAPEGMHEYTPSRNVFFTTGPRLR